MDGQMFYITRLVLDKDKLIVPYCLVLQHRHKKPRLLYLYQTTNRDTLCRSPVDKQEGYGYQNCSTK